ncbi:MAG: cyclic nucleotide-binding domain-containing protein [Acidimicrobiales bacterium]|jgi:predicted MFS family arabinose efflux permease
MFLRIGAVFSVFRAALGNPTLRRVGIAYGLFVASEFGVWITLLVFAYGHGGASASLVMVLVQLIPCMVLGPFIGAFVDRRRPSRVLRIGYGLQAISMAAVAAAIGLRAPTFVVFVLAPLTSISFTTTRSPQAALLPAIVRTPDELTAANVMNGWTDGAASLVGPALAGVLLAWSGAKAAVAANAAMSLVGMLLLLGVVGPAPAIASVDAPRKGENSGGMSPSPGGRVAEFGRSLTSIRAGAGSNLARAVRNPEIRVLLTLHTFYFVLIGALDLLCVVLAVDFLHMGPGGAGFLNAALGGGALLAAFVTAFLVGRHHLSKTLTAALLVAVGALALIDATPRVIPVLGLIGIVGLAGAVFDTTGRTLLQRSAPSDAIAGTFSILESLMDFGLATGVILVRVALSIGGLKAALLAPAVCAGALLTVLWRRLRRIDDSATVPQVEIQLLRSISIFTPLPAPSLEGIARELVALTVPEGTAVIREGDGGDCYYAVADGRLAISRAGQLLHMASRGDGFGEIALIRDVPRTATVTAVTDALLYSLRKDLFVETVTGHASASSAARTVIARHMSDTDVPPADGDSMGIGDQ